MFTKEELELLKELVELEIDDIKDMINSSEGSDRKDLEEHLKKVEALLAKLK